MQGTVISVKPADKKGSAVKIELSLGGEKRIYTVSEGTYREIGCPLSAETIDSAALGIIDGEDRRRRAMKKALNILAYADNNSKNLYRKLIIAGFSKDEASLTVKECIRLGYIDEAGQIERLIIRYCESELLGPAKIFAKLAAKGYKPAEISEVMNRLREAGEIDFTESRRRLIEKKRPETYEERQKLLYKYGYKNETD